MFQKDTKVVKKMNVQVFLDMLAELYGAANNVQVTYTIHKKGTEAR